MLIFEELKMHVTMSFGRLLCMLLACCLDMKGSILKGARHECHLLGVCSILIAGKPVWLISEDPPECQAPKASVQVAKALNVPKDLAERLYNLAARECMHCGISSKKDIQPVTQDP